MYSQNTSHQHTKPFLVSEHLISSHSTHVFFSFAGRAFLKLCLMHLFLFIYSASQSRTCWYFVKLPMSHCMLTPSHFPHAVGLSRTHSNTHTELCYLNSCARHSVCLLVLLWWCYSCHFYPFTLQSFLMSLWETIGEFNSTNLNGLLLVAALGTAVGEGHFMNSSLKDIVDSLENMLNPFFSESQGVDWTPLCLFVKYEVKTRSCLAKWNTFEIRKNS